MRLAGTGIGTAGTLAAVGFSANSLAADANPDASDIPSIRLADAFTTYLSMNKVVYGKVIDGVHYDCGNKFEYSVATVEAALDHPEVNKNKAFAAYLKKRVKEL